MFARQALLGKLLHTIMLHDVVLGEDQIIFDFAFQPESRERIERLLPVPSHVRFEILNSTSPPRPPQSSATSLISLVQAREHKLSALYCSVHMVVRNSGGTSLRDLKVLSLSPNNLSKRSELQDH
jgi:hypothetical protein